MHVHVHFVIVMHIWLCTVFILFRLCRIGAFVLYTSSEHYHSFIGRSLSEFAGYLQEYMQSEDRRLSPTSEERLRLQYKGSVRSSNDPYKRAVYCLLARCEVNDNHSVVCDKIDDYMWLKVRLKLIIYL